MKITYDKVADACYISINESNKQKIKTDSFSIDSLVKFGDINFDFDQNHKIVGIEILNATEYLSEEVLNDSK